MNSPYRLDTLMEQTRILAAQYRLQTGDTLAVSCELARYDVQQLLHFSVPQEKKPGVDLIGVGAFEDQSIQIKSRVIFDRDKGHYRIGHIQPEAPWQWVFLVQYNKDYQPTEICAAQKDVLLCQLKEKSNKRGMTVRQFKILSKQVWSLD